MKFIHEIIIVEGRYDKNTVSQAVGGTVIETSGFGIFSDKEKLALLRKLAEKRGLIILTDSDRAGFFIRGRLRGMLGNANIKHAYIPDVKGREKRKAAASKEGKLGVEGMTPDVILDALSRAGATFLDAPESAEPNAKITKADLYGFGLSGGPGSANNRRLFLKNQGLPERLSSTGLLEAMNILYSRDEFLSYIQNTGGEI